MYWISSIYVEAASDFGMPLISIFYTVRDSWLPILYRILYPLRALAFLGYRISWPSE